jgi:hypothetical protein
MHSHNLIPAGENNEAGADAVASLTANFRRALPTTVGSKGENDTDASVITGIPNYTLGTDGILRATERIDGEWRVSTVTPDAPDAYDQENWAPGRQIRLSPNQRRAIDLYQKGKISYEKALKMGGINAN